jgi:hypothetical protein
MEWRIGRNRNIRKLAEIVGSEWIQRYISWISFQVRKRLHLLPVLWIRIGFHPDLAFYPYVDPDPESQINADLDRDQTLPVTENGIFIHKKLTFCR